MKDGERRVIPKQRTHIDEMTVVAHRVDSDTPYVILQTVEGEKWLTDVEAEELILRIRKALSILPTSK